MSNRERVVDTVLVVEDDVVDRRLIGRCLSRMAHPVGRVLTCDRLETAHQLVAEGGIELCLLDLRLPDGDGIDFLRAHPAEHRTFPIIVLTGGLGADAAEAALEAGADDYLAKATLDPELLDRVVLYATRRHAQATELRRRGQEVQEQAARLRDQLMVNQKLRPFLPEPAVAAVLDDPSGPAAAGPGREMVISLLLVDIVGFTERCAACSPKEAVAALNRWFSVVDPIVEAAQGVVDKRMGDAVLALFLPGQGGATAPRAVVTAARLMAATQQLSMPLAGVRSFGNFAVRCAVHHGPVFAGLIGSPRRLEYTVIGPVVNATARLEGITPPGRVWLSRQAVDAGGPALRAHCRSRGSHHLRGITEPLEVEELAFEGTSAELAATLAASLASPLAVAPDAEASQDVDPLGPVTG